MAISTRVHLLLAILLLLPLCGRPVAQPREHFRFDHLRVEQGLSQGSINAMLQDRTGFLWIGTDDGLNRFDGYQFVVLRPDPLDRHALAGNVVTALSLDASGMLWIGTSGSGFQSFDPATWTFTSYPHTLPSGTSVRDEIITAIQADASRRIWIGTDHEGLLVFDTKTEALRQFPLPASVPAPAVTDIALAPSGKLIVACGRVGLFVIDPGTARARRIVLDGVPAAPAAAMRVSMDSARYLWVGSDASGIHRYDVRTGKWKLYPLPSDPGSNYSIEIRDMVTDREGNLWVSTAADGVFVLRMESGSFMHLVADPLTPMSLPGSSTRSLYADRLGNIWVGTNGNGIGLHSYAVKEFNRVGTGLLTHGELTVHSYRAIWQDRDSVLWVGGYRGFNRLDRKNGKVTVYGRRNHPHGSRDPSRETYLHNVFAIHPDPADPKGALLLGTEGDGLFRFEKKSASFRRIPLEDAEGRGSERQTINVSEIYQTRDGMVWIGCSTGLWRWDAAKRGRRPERIAARSFSERQGGVQAIHEDRNGFLWIGMARGGIALYLSLIHI
jgi:ligand-binding sensor domain-containing protein